MALQVPHANPTVSAGLHRVEAYLSGRYQSNPCRWGRAQQVFCPGDLLGFEHHSLVPKQSKALVVELMVTYLQHGARKGSACCVHHTQLPAGSCSVCRRNQSCQSLPFAEGPKPGLAISLCFRITWTHAMSLPILMNFADALSFVHRQQILKAELNQDLEKKSTAFKIYVFNNHLWESLFFWKST